MIHAGGWHQLAPFFCAQRARFGLRKIGWRVFLVLRWVEKDRPARFATNR